MKRYLMFFGYVKTVLIALVALLGLAIIALDIVMISGKVAHFATTNVAIASVSLAAAALIDIFALLLLFNSRYTLKDDGISVVIAVFFDKVPYDEVRTISVNAVTDEVFVAWCKPSGDRGLAPCWYAGSVALRCNCSGGVRQASHVVRKKGP